MTDTVDSFSDMLCVALGDRLAPADGYLDMLAPDAVMEFPYAPPGLPPRVKGRQAIGGYLARLSTLLAFDRIAHPVVHRTHDPALTILEFEGFGRGVATGAAYEQRYISVVRTGGGRIVHYRDYWNPLAILAATKDPQPTDAITVEVPDRG